MKQGHGVRERVSGRRENPAGESSRVGCEEGDVRPTEWHKTQGVTARECKGESGCRRALIPLVWTSCPRGTKPPEWALRDR